LNIALQSLPSDCNTVAWLDCDVVFDSDHWADRADALLETYKIVMPFKHTYELPKNGQLEDTDSKGVPRYSVIYAPASGMVSPEALRGTLRTKDRITCGFAFVARRATLEKCGLCDACVMGGGDKAIACAALGRFDIAIDYLQMNPGWAKHYVAWAEPFFETVRGNVTYLEDDVFHLWHGQLENRRYGERHAVLREFGFDPANDIVTDKDGCWRWSPSRVDE
jgi:hypothetical protein